MEQSVDSLLQVQCISHQIFCLLILFVLTKVCWVILCRENCIYQ
jgi:hypothetical protein